MTEPICIEPGCNAPAPYAPKTKRCGSCHYRWQREHGKKHMATCVMCGTEYTTYRKPRGNPCCSAKCRQLFAQPFAVAAPRKAKPSTTIAKQCEWCLALHFGATKMCSDQCREANANRRAQAKRGVLRAAYEDGDWPIVMATLLAKTTGSSDCREWTGKMNSGYPVVRIAGREHQVHRLILQAKHEGMPLGVQAAHHMCANAMCINPEHLQPVTHRDNIAEMLARHSYLDRIAELESALAEINPGHPVLNRIDVA